MFYSQFILAKKGPLGTIWIAAHLERKLRKNQVADTDIGVSVDSILFPDMPIALRLSSHLLLGVVRIYSRKVNYLFDDCSEALLKVKQAFRSAAVDLPPEESKAPYHSITLPETFDLDDFELPDNEIFQGNYVDHHVSSREQITLQDTMDGVVYSTSQFGLDERFGDGDTSHIGLELDEELLLDKDAAQENNIVQEYCAQGSDETTMTNKEDANDSAAMQVDDIENQLEDLPTKSESFEYAQAPATPGLVEVPNLSSFQEGLACDDHIEPEDEYLTEPAAAEIDLQTTDTNLVDQSLNNDLNNGSIVGTVPENGFLSGDMDKNPGTSQENTESNAIHVADGALSGLDGGPKSVDRTDGECGESPSCSNVTYDTEDAGKRVTSNSQSLPVTKESGQDTVNPADHTEATKNKNTCLSDSPCRPTIVDYEAQACLEPKDFAQEEVSSARIHVLQPCTSRHDLPSLEGEGCINKESEPGLREETHGDGGNSYEQPNNVIPCEDHQLENSNHDGTSDPPAPEKLLSVTEGLDRPTDLLIESTPDKEVLGTTDGSAYGANPISGRKRNYTESTLTVESINSVESFGQTRSKRFVDSVPDDDDLLSSILVGRKSSVLKLKPTPAFEVASAKRARYASRPNMSKRKVLMDDSMVLHGDTIRQQLTDTEDIRRVRKKAPCSRPEISMIQRQFMEDEIFRQSVHTDMSAELRSLHSRKYDLSGISISEVDENHASTEVANGAECSVIPEVGCETGAEGTIHRDQNEVQPVGTPQTESHQQNISGVAEVSESLQREPLNETAEIEVDKRTAEVADVANESVIDGFEVLSRLDPDERLSTQPGEVDASIDDTRNSKGTDGIDNVMPEIDNNIASEFEQNAGDVSLAEGSKLGTPVEINPDLQADCSVPNEDGIGYLETLNVETGGFLNGAEAGTKKVGELNEDLGKDACMELEDKDTTNMCEEEPKMDSNDGEKPATDEVDTVDAEITAQESENIAIANDTEFLNVDDEFGEEDDEGMQYGEETGILDNSGWSSRTRAVAKYLQNLFDNETAQGKKVLPVDGLLAGKTRKEAARMFFETLVLKTKDYIQVEQPRPFDNISVKARAKLLKSDF